MSDQEMTDWLLDNCKDEISMAMEEMETFWVQRPAGVTLGGLWQCTERLIERKLQRDDSETTRLLTTLVYRMAFVIFKKKLESELQQ